MTANSGRIRTTVISRTTDGNFASVEIFTLGSGSNTQRQCCSGELVFDTAKDKFLVVPLSAEQKESRKLAGKVDPNLPSKRKPFDVKEAKPSVSRSLKDRSGK